jgi:hypothetical protein
MKGQLQGSKTHAVAQMQAIGTLLGGTAYGLDLQVGLQASEQTRLGLLGSGLPIPKVHQLPRAGQIPVADARSLPPTVVLKLEDPGSRFGLRH